MLLGNINIAINYDNKSLALANSLLDGFENNKIDTKYDDIILLILKNKGSSVLVMLNYFF